MKYEKDLISVIIPIYNMEKYLEKCLNSILNQTYKNLEIICIDDGSIDNSNNIIQEFLKKDNRIKLIQQKNKGLGCARNIGIENSNGNYITFVDSDDWIKEDFCEYLYKNIIKYNTDLVALPLCPISENGKILRDIYDKKINILKDSEAIENMFLRDGISWCAPSKLYKKELWRDIRFPEGILMEDKATLYKIYSKCKKILFIRENKYMYLIRKGSIMHSKFSEKKLDSFKIQFDMSKFLEKNYPQKVILSNAYLVKISLIYLCEMSVYNYDNFGIMEELFKYLKKYRKDFFRANIIDVRFKLLNILFIVMRFLYGEKIYAKKIYKYICLKVINIYLNRL